jgi:signal transduction histidine kinase/DNA-binding response OmpR family regulator
MKFRNMKIRTKLLVVAIAIGFTPVIIIGGVALFESRNALSNQAFAHLESVRELKKTQLEAFFIERKNDMHVLLDMVANLKQNAIQKLQAVQHNQKLQLEWYFQERLHDAHTLSKNHSLAEAVAKFHSVIHTEEHKDHKDQKHNALAEKHEHHALEEETDWQSIEAIFGDELKQAGQEYDDLFLIAKDGHIVYTVKQGPELGRNVLGDLLKNTHLHQAFQKGLSGVAIQDFAPYEPANDQYMAFIAAPIFHHDELIGVCIFSLSPTAINAIVQNREGMRKTEGTYLMGQLNGQTRYRSNRVLKGKEARIGDKKSGAEIDKALKGQSGIVIKTGSTGDLEMGAYAPLQITDINWGIFTTIKFEEVLVPMLIGEQKDFFGHYALQYGYSDLFLIHPEGEIFYSVEHESDYQTNILNGRYAKSGLGQLIREVLETKQFGMSDFAPYAPSNDKPAAFFAEPLLHKGKIELIVALQVNDSEINGIMQQRAGMGKTGEAYLVGSDKLMRSNSYIDPDHHSITASFANPSLGMVDTEASRAALAGETGQKIIKDYRHTIALSAYTPIKVGNTTWALIVEIDKAEEFAPIVQLEWLLGGAALFMAIITLFFINRGTKHLTAPLLLINNHLKVLAQGKPVDGEIKYQMADEIGELVTSASKLKEGMKNSIAQANAIAAGNYSTEVKLLSEEDQLGQALSDMTRILHETTIKNNKQDWLKTGQAHLNDLMSGEQDLDTLAKNIITFLTTYVEAQVGLFYLLTEAEQENQKPYLQVVASYAYTVSDNRRNKFFVGEGLVGQAVLERKTLFRSLMPEEYTYIVQSGLSQAVPSHVLLLPFLYETTVKGVIEMGYSKEIPDIQREFLEQAMSSIGIALNTAESRIKMQRLLKETQVQAVELESQQAVLQHTNQQLKSQQEELERKQAELQQNNEELQSQSEELQTQSEELQTQSEELQTQQEELEQTNEQLEARTKELEQQKSDVQRKNIDLEQAKTEVEKARTAIETKAQELALASKYKSEFLANMSHELRTPLNSLLILGQLLMENKPGNLTEKQVEYAKTIYSAGSDLLTLINEILDLSKVEAGKIEIHTEEVSLTDLLEAIDHKFRHVAENKGLGFHLTMDKDIPSLLSTDGQRFNQIINNLLSNAFKFTRKGEIRLMVQRASNTFISQNVDFSMMKLEPNKTISISVTDTGIGIPKEKEQVIFEAFQQVDGTTSRKYGGTGLGLSISRQLARLLGGELTLYTEEGKGSTFTLYLPIEGAKQNRVVSKKLASQDIFMSQNNQGRESPEIAKEQVHQEMLPNTPLSDDRENIQPTDKTILIVEDDRKFSSILMDFTHEKGMKYLIAEDGKTGLQLAEKFHPNAILLDVGLPQLDGWTVMERLKDNPETRHIPVHFVSAADEDMDAKKMGAIGYLHKPVSRELLGDVFKKIEKFINNTVRYLLVVSDHKARREKILVLVENGDVQTTVAATIESALQNLEKGSFDCIILDMNIKEGSGSKLLDQLRKKPVLSQIPIIVYAERNLTQVEEALLLQCAKNLPIKSVRSPERLVDEVALFLHQIEAKLPEKKRDMIRMVHDKEAILKDKKVLIVDDDVRNVFALATVLEDKDMEIVTGMDGKEGLAILDEHDDIAMVLMDIMMPEMDGYEAMRKIRQHPKYHSLPIIALTAKAMKGDKAKCIEAGANDYLSKPVDTDKLLSLMRVWLYR